jgi:hypothetical protein
MLQSVSLRPAKEIGVRWKGTSSKRLRVLTLRGTTLPCSTSLSPSRAHFLSLRSEAYPSVYDDGISLVLHKKDPPQLSQTEVGHDERRCGVGSPRFQIGFALIAWPGAITSCHPVQSPLPAIAPK